MTSLAALADEMRTKGAFPAWSPRMILRLGDDLRDVAESGPSPRELVTLGGDVVATCRELGLIAADTQVTPEVAWTLLEARIEGMAELPALVRAILINFGALDPADDVTSLTDLLAVLLPPGEGN